jgi:hypothetical protein
VGPEDRLHRIDGDGLTHASVKDLETGAKVEVGRYIVVGNEEADPAVAQVVAIDERGMVLVRVLPGPDEDHST